MAKLFPWKFSSLKICYSIQAWKNKYPRISLSIVISFSCVHTIIIRRTVTPLQFQGFRSAGDAYGGDEGNSFPSSAPLDKVLYENCCFNSCPEVYNFAFRACEPHN